MNAVQYSIAYEFGRRDALAQELCVPEMFFVRRDDKAVYATGWASVNGHNATTRQLTKAELEADVAFDAPATVSYFAHLFPENIEAELAEQIEGRLDNEFWAGGQW